MKAALSWHALTLRRAAPSSESARASELWRAHNNTRAAASGAVCTPYTSGDVHEGTGTYPQERRAHQHARRRLRSGARTPKRTPSPQERRAHTNIRATASGAARAHHHARRRLKISTPRRRPGRRPSTRARCGPCRRRRASPGAGSPPAPGRRPSTRARCGPCRRRRASPGAAAGGRRGTG